MNVALYGRRGKRWAMTERGRSAVECSSSYLTIGPSALCWEGGTLTVDIEEVTAPVPSRLQGRIRLHPCALADYQAPLHATVRHRWSPIAPCARAEVEMKRPALRWSGPGYFDSNAGDEPLEAAFRGWDWSRAPHRGGTSVLYDVENRDGTPGANIAVHFDAAGGAEPMPAPGHTPLPRTAVWRIARGTRADPADPARVVKTLEDTPFYARSVIASRLAGESVMAVHESLSLERFRRRWVQMLLPFRMPRVGE